MGCDNLVSKPSVILRLMVDDLGECDLILPSDLCSQVNLASVDILVSGPLPKARALLGHS